MRYKGTKFSAQEILRVWIEVETDYREKEFDTFIRKLELAVEQTVIYKFNEVLGSEPPHLKGGMHNLREKGLINEKQSNLHWLCDILNEYAHRGVDLQHNDAERAIKIGRTIVIGCFQEHMQFKGESTQPSQEKNLESVSKTQDDHFKVIEEIDEEIPAFEDFFPNKKELERRLDSIGTIPEILVDPEEKNQEINIIPKELLETEIEFEQPEPEEIILETSAIPEELLETEIEFEQPESEEIIPETSVIPEELLEADTEDEQPESQEIIQETSIIQEENLKSISEAKIIETKVNEKIYGKILAVEDSIPDKKEEEINLESVERIQETTIVPEKLFEEETEEEKLISLEIIEITDVKTDDFFKEEEKEQEQIKSLESQPEEEIETSSTTSSDSTQEDDFIKEFEKKTYRFCPKCGYKNLRTDDICVNCWIRFE
jgi:hypothetical protein